MKLSDSDMKELHLTILALNLTILVAADTVLVQLTIMATAAVKMPRERYNTYR